jgi:hypothetical protein
MIPLLVYAQTPWDKYTLDGGWQQWLRWRADAVSGWSPAQDKNVGRFARLWAYLDAYAIYNPSGVATQHPDWVLKDTSGKPLYIPWGCVNGTCPQYAGDITNPDFVAYQMSCIGALLPLGYTGLYLDDVNLELKVGDGTGALVAPAGVTPESWADHMATYLEKIRSTFKLLEVAHNSVWFANAPADAVSRQVEACDYVNYERGFGDPNLTPGKMVEQFLSIDNVHQAGRHVIQMEYQHAAPDLGFLVGCFLLAYQPGDLMAVLDLFPDAWDPLRMDVNLGSAVSKATQVSATQWGRTFAHGGVLVDLQAKTGTIAGTA